MLAVRRLDTVVDGDDGNFPYCWSLCSDQPATLSIARLPSRNLDAICVPAIYHLSFGYETLEAKIRVWAHGCHSAVDPP